MKPIKNVVAAVIKKGDLYFAAMRSEDGFRLNKWEFPGGKIEEGETKEAAIIREIREELDVLISVDTHLLSTFHEYDTFNIKLDVFMCSTTEDIEHLHVHKKGGFFTLVELRTLDFLPADLPVLSLL